MNNNLQNYYEIDLIEMLKDIIKNIKFIIKITVICGFIVFVISQFVLPKKYTSNTEISIVSDGETLDYSSYLVASSVLDKVSSKVGVDKSILLDSIEVSKNSDNSYNYRIKVITNNPQISYRIAKNVVKEFKNELSDELNLSSVNVIKSAVVDTEPVSPNVQKNTFMGTALGFIVSLGFVVICFLFDPHFKNLEEVECTLGVDVLAEIPNDSQNAMTCKVDSSSAFRKLRTNIVYNEKYPNVQSICLTGADHGAGSTSLAYNLANCFMANTPKVLLIDCNICEPHIHECFNINNDIGLTDILKNKEYSNYAKYTKCYKEKDSDNSLYVITTGREVNYPIDLLSDQCFKEFIRKMKSEFDFIILDCPSLEDNCDIIPVSHLVDGTILVVSLPSTKKKIAVKSMERLKRNGHKIIGAVLNNA